MTTPPTPTPWSRKAERTAVYKVLKDFKGSPDGRFAVDYKAPAPAVQTTRAKKAKEETYV